MEAALISVRDSACVVDYQMFTEKGAIAVFCDSTSLCETVIKAYGITSSQRKEEEGSCFRINSR